MVSAVLHIPHCRDHVLLNEILYQGPDLRLGDIGVHGDAVGPRGLHQILLPPFLFWRVCGNRFVVLGVFHDDDGVLDVSRGKVFQELLNPLNEVLPVKHSVVFLGALFDVFENLQGVVHQRPPLCRGALLFRHAVVVFYDGLDEAVAATFVLGLEDQFRLFFWVLQRVLVPLVAVVDVVLVHVNNAALLSFFLLHHAPHVLFALDQYLFLQAVVLAPLFLAAAITLLREKSLHASQR